MKYHRPHRRKASTGDRTRGPARTWRITASWDTRPDRPAVRTTTDKRARDRMADDFAVDGAYVIVEEARGGFEWRTLREIDGPALIAEATAEAEAAATERHRRDQAEAAARAYRHAADYAKQTARNMLAAHLDAADARDRLARLMTQPPSRLDQRARHTAGGR
ncbi:hypothetical protein OG909_12110 [Streptomyces sp. NBC_01754]|uniref:hypothetical protein n=1 Tax=Streptomyces sp. NBC_01754 TaxID=2975930 RepID=UPI002DD88AF5|nr:hypothetical protein [Streptomyces sp. NBC_01754]WSC92978.1 hypothetical protein OG909_12110 [Streptomyces sp. NBC_01754]